MSPPGNFNGRTTNESVVNAILSESNSRTVASCCAFASEPPSVGTIKLLIAGGGNPQYLEELKTRFTSTAIEFLGIVDPRSLFSRIHLLVAPSLWEDPLPRVIAEAHASGIPVAISKLGGMPEIVEDNVTGYYFEANKPEAITALFTRLHGETLPTQAQIEACKNRVFYFSVESVFKRHQDLWSGALAK